MCSGMYLHMWLVNDAELNSMNLCLPNSGEKNNFDSCVCVVSVNISVSVFRVRRIQTVSSPKDLSQSLIANRESKY